MIMKIDTKIFDKLTLNQWKEKIFHRSVNIKYPEQLKYLVDEMYPNKIARLNERLKESSGEELEFLNAKIIRLTDKYATCKKMLALRDAKSVPTTKEWAMYGTTYYIDLDNGNDARTGLKIDGTIDSTADTTHFVDAALTGVDDYINGSYFYNVTRSLGSLITDFDAGTDTVTLADAIAGMTAGDTYYILDAWLTLEQYTTTTVRTAGDIAYVRANTTETVGANDIIFDENGTVDAYISIVGCDSVINDPWVDSSDVRPIIDFGDQQYQFNITSDDFWKLESLDIIQSADINGNIYANSTAGIYLLNCIIRDNSSATAYKKFGVYYIDSRNFKMEDCALLDNLYSNTKLNYSSGIFDNCTFNGGVTTTTNGINSNASTIVVKNCSFGLTTAHGDYDIRPSNSSFIQFINCASTKYIYSKDGSVVFIEDNNQVKGANSVYTYNGIITKSTGVVRSGGASSSALMQPDADCGLYAPLSISPFNEHDFSIYASATETTVTIYIRSYGAWAAYPTNAELYIGASYLDHGSDATRTLINSTAVLDDETTWRPFTITFTPLQAGFVYLKVYLKKYEASKGCYVDMKINNKLFDWVNAMPSELKPSSTGFIMM